MVQLCLSFSFGHLALKFSGQTFVRAFKYVSAASTCGPFPAENDCLVRNFTSSERLTSRRSQLTSCRQTTAHGGYISVHFFFFSLSASIIVSSFLLCFPAPVIPGDAFIPSEEPDSPRLQPKHAALWQEAPVKEPSALHYLCFATRSTHQLLKKVAFFSAVDLPVKKKKKDKKWRL